jgi:hypothetical protein
MALPTSGALTFANIQTEFGGSNPISLSEYYAGGAYVPSGTSGTNGAVPTSGAISIWHFYGTSAETNWIAVLNRDTNMPTVGWSVAVDKSGSVILGAGANATWASENYPLLVKISPTGSVSWSITDNNLASRAQSFAFDSSNNIYAGYVANGAYSEASFFKLNGASPTSVLWSKKLNITNYNYAHINIDSSDTVYVAGSYYDNDISSGVVYLHKFNAAGTHLLGKRGWLSETVTCNEASIDGSSNVFYTGQSIYYDDWYEEYLPCGFLSKINSSGVHQWSKYLENGGFGYSLFAVKATSAGNAYFGGDTMGTAVLLKANSAGTFIWKSAVSIGSSAASCEDLAVDASENAYMLLRYAENSIQKYAVIKYNSSGTVVWQRSIALNTNAVSFNLYGITVNNSGGSFIVTGFAEPSQLKAVVLKLPTDGSKTGNYTVGGVTFVYAAASATFTTPTETQGTFGMGIADIVPTAASRSFSSTTVTNSALTV